MVWIPLWATLVVITFLVEAMDKSVSLLPLSYQPKALLGFNIPGLGILLCFFVLFFTGLLVANFIGEKFVRLGERILNKIPLVRSVYQAAKQVTETLLSSNSEAFRKVLLVEYPRRGLWSIAFQTATKSQLIQEDMAEDAMTVFIPTTPNPTSGFLFIVNKSDTKPLNMTVDEALKMVISLGVMQPNGSKIK